MLHVLIFAPLENNSYCLLIILCYFPLFLVSHALKQCISQDKYWVIPKLLSHVLMLFRVFSSSQFAMYIGIDFQEMGLLLFAILLWE